MNLVRLALRSHRAPLAETQATKVAPKETMFENPEYKNRTVALEMRGVTKGVFVVSMLSLLISLPSPSSPFPREGGGGGGGGEVLASFLC